MSSVAVTRDILVWRDKEHLLRLKSRIELLFGVGLNFSSPSAKILARGDGESEWIKVYGPSEDACLRTQKYVLAACRPDCTVVVPCGSQLPNLLFSKSPKLRDAIEKEYQTLLLPSPDGILVQGSESAVSFTITKLQSLMDTLQKQDLPDSTPSSVELNQRLRELISNPGAVDTISESLRQALLESLSESSNEKKKDSPPLSPRSTRLQKRVKQFVDLGYPREKVEMAMRSLGDSASDNDIMARLVSIHSSYDPKSLSKVPPKPQPTEQGNQHQLPPLALNQRDGLRPIVIDGSNIAMSHGNGSTFSCRGILIAVNWFLKRGHSEITVFVPQWRKEPSKPESPISEQEILFDLAKSNIINFTPSRRVRDKKIVCYDDRFIVRLAAERGGVIVSNDHFRDLLEENPAWREAIENRLLMYTFVGDTFMVPSDPLGKHGPHLDVFLRFEGGKTPSSETSNEHSVPRDKQPCPYKERCTFGPRCRYYHPERAEKQKAESRDASPAYSPEYKKDDMMLPVNKLSPSKHRPHPMDLAYDRPGGLVNYSLPPQGRDSAYRMPPERTFSPTYGMPRDQWGRGRDDAIRPPSGTLARGNHGDYPSTPDPIHPGTPQSYHPSYPRLPHPEYRPPSSTTPNFPEQYIDHNALRPGRIETAPVHRHVYTPVSYPTRPHTIHHAYAPSPHVHQYYDQRDSAQSIYERALMMFPNDHERIKIFLHTYPHVKDINVLIQYLNRSKPNL